MASPADVTYQDLDYYAVLEVSPASSADEVRVGFRRAVLRHHPDRSRAPAGLATRRTSVLNQAWSELRDPDRRRAYDGLLARGVAPTLAWPVTDGERRRATPRRLPPTRRRAEPSPWHQPAWRSVAGFRVPAAVALQDPEAQRRWIVDHYVDGQDWRDHHERYWLRFAAEHYRDRGRLADWVGAVERLVEVEPSFDSLVRAGLREAYLATDRHLAGATFLAEIAGRWPPAVPARAWVEREQRALLSDFRERHVRRGPPPARAANAELLLDYLDGAALEPGFADLRAAHRAVRRSGNHARASEILARLLAAPVDGGDGWFARVQLLTEAGELEQASSLLATIARGEHPEALDPGQVRGPPSLRLARARDRLARARRARWRADPGPASRPGPG